MAFEDDEQRNLAEIERGLVEEDPRLARRFGPRPAHSPAGVVAGVVVVFLVGLAVLVTGIRLAAPSVVVAGLVVTAALPALAGWILSSRL